MILPGLIAIAAPIIVGFFIGAHALGGMLAGSIIAGFLLAIFMANAGGAWDNAKKYIELGNFGGKGSDPHAAAVTGDTVGDPFKDTSGPAINILLKLMAVVSLIFGPVVHLIAAPFSIGTLLPSSKRWITQQTTDEKRAAGTILPLFVKECWLLLADQLISGDRLCATRKHRIQSPLVVVRVGVDCGYGISDDEGAIALLQRVINRVLNRHTQVESPPTKMRRTPRRSKCASRVVPSKPEYASVPASSPLRTMLVPIGSFNS